MHLPCIYMTIIKKNSKIKVPLKYLIDINTEQKTKEYFVRSHFFSSDLKENNEEEVVVENNFKFHFIKSLINLSEIK